MPPSRSRLSAVAFAAVLCAAAAPAGVDQARRWLDDGAGEARVARAPDGHFWAEARAGGASARLLIDTGASAVALTAEDARRLGVDMTALRFDRALTGSGGRLEAAEVVLDRLTVGGAELRSVRALVVAEGLDRSLLGMSYLGRLSRIEATPREMVLRR